MEPPLVSKPFDLPSPTRIKSWPYRCDSSDKKRSWHHVALCRAPLNCGLRNCDRSLLVICRQLSLKLIHPAYPALW